MAWSVAPSAAVQGTELARTTWSDSSSEWQDGTGAGDGLGGSGRGGGE